MGSNRGKSITIRFKDTSKPMVKLTVREADCIRIIMQGFTLKEAGVELGLSVRTVEFYYNNVKEKLNCRKRSEIIRRLIASDFMKNVDRG